MIYPTQEEIKDRFEYNDGRLLYRESNNRVKKGGEAGFSVGKYRAIRWNSKNYLTHRLVWMYFNGAITEGYEIDHINHNPIDNRIENLRAVTHLDNLKNKVIGKNNKTGVMGVHYMKSERYKNRWQAYINKGGRTIHLGFYPTKEKAHEVRKQAEKHHNYHPEHNKCATV